METKTEKNDSGCQTCNCVTPDKTECSLTKTFSEDSCPDCGSVDLRFGSRDPCEGDYYHCKNCGLLILFPLNYRRKFIAPIVDAESSGTVLICEYCGKQYSSFPSRIGKRHHCSKECKDATIRGKPNPERAAAYKGRFKGSENPNFKGDDVGYHGIHKWVYRNIPRPVVCQRCNKIPERGRIEAHNISGEYQRDPSDWIYVCTACHQELDGRHAKLVENAIKHRNNLGRLTVGCSEIVDAELEQRKAHNAATKGKFARPRIVAEEPIASPHPWMDPIIRVPAESAEKRVYFTKIREAL